MKPSLSRHTVDRFGMMHAGDHSYAIVTDFSQEYLLEASAPWRLRYVAWLSRQPRVLADIASTIIEPKVHLVGTTTRFDDARINSEVALQVERESLNRGKRAIGRLSNAVVKTVLGSALAAVAVSTATTMPPVIAIGVAAAAAIEAVIGKNLLNKSTADFMDDRPWMDGPMFGGSESDGLAGPTVMPADIAARVRAYSDAKNPWQDREVAIGAAPGPGWDIDLRSSRPLALKPARLDPPKPAVIREKAISLELTPEIETGAEAGIRLATRI